MQETRFLGEYAEPFYAPFPMSFLPLQVDHLWEIAINECQNESTNHGASPFVHGSVLHAEQRDGASRSILGLRNYFASKVHHSSVVSFTGRASMVAPSNTVLVGVGHAFPKQETATSTSQPAWAKCWSKE